MVNIMFKSIKTSKENKTRVQELTHKLNLGAENIIARIALGYSLSKNKRLSIEEIKDSGGKEYSTNVLFGEHLKDYTALVCTHYKIYKTDKDLQKYFKLHIDDGLGILYNEFHSTKNLSGFEFLARIIDQGIQTRN